MSARVPAPARKFNFTLSTDSPLGKKGTKIELDMTPGDVHVPIELPTFLAGYRPAGRRADEFSPVILVDADNGKFRMFTSDNTFEPVDVKTSIGGHVEEIDPETELGEYKLQERAIGAFIPRQLEQNAAAGTGLYRLRQAAMKRCQNVISLDREIDVWTLLTTLTSWDSTVRTTLGSTTKWNGGSASDPLADLQTREEASAQEITDWAMSPRTANAFLRHPSVRDHMRQMLGDNAVNQAVTTVNNTQARNRDFLIPGLAPIRVIAGKKKAAAGGLEYIIGNHVVGIAKPPGVPTDGEDIASSYTFRRRGNAGVGYETREVPWETRGSAGGTFVVVNMADIAKMISTLAGGLIRDAYI